MKSDKKEADRTRLRPAQNAELNTAQSQTRFGIFRSSPPYTEVLFSPFFGLGMYTQVLLIGKTTVYRGSFDRIPVYYLYSKEYILGGRQSPTLPELSLTTSYAHFARSRYRSFAVASAHHACSKLARKRINGLSRSLKEERVS
jgi:hypothetical protein